MDAVAADSWLAGRAPGTPAGVGGLVPALTESGHAAAVDRIRNYISAGDCYQVNFTFPLSFTWFGHPLDLYRRLRERQPVSYGGFVGGERDALVSLSPELFLERRGGRLVARPMKGTLARTRPAAELAASAKDRAENLMIVDLLRNDLGRIAQPGSVVVDRLFAVEDYPTVRQMVSEISASAPGATLGDVLRALFPCGSVTGAPKIRAMQIIGELEGGARGLYTGSLGWIAPDGDFRLNVAIRTLELLPGHAGRLGIGSGIVADSGAADEWQECVIKANFLADLEPGVELVETLRRENGKYPRLAGHMARIETSARWLGFAFDPGKVREALAQPPAEGAWRVRLALARSGEVALRAEPLLPEPAGPRQAQLATVRIDPDNPLRRHKTTDRAVYDEALAALADRPEVFDAVFLNLRGEVAEGARSNVFVERDGILLTPPVGSGALPGVLRAELIASGRAREAVLLPGDLAGGFWLGNALRGLVKVSLAGT